MPVWFVWLIYALAVARLTGLVTADEITRPLRDGILRRLNEDRPAHQAIATLITCAWCASMWIALVAAPLVYWHGTNPILLILALALALSWIAGATSSLGRE